MRNSHEDGLDVSVLHELFSVSGDGVLLRRKSGKPCGWLSGSGYLYLRLRGRQWKIHRIIFAMVNGHWPRTNIDHINGDPLDNRPSNLREATLEQNARNSANYKNNTSGYRGVRRVSGMDNRWRARITVSGKQIHLGSFESAEEAGLAYEVASDRYFGEYKRSPEWETMRAQNPKEG